MSILFCTILISGIAWLYVAGVMTFMSLQDDVGITFLSLVWFVAVPYFWAVSFILPLDELDDD